MLKPCPMCQKPPIMTIEEEFTSDGKVYRFACHIHLYPKADAHGIGEAEEVWNAAVDRHNERIERARRKHDEPRSIIDDAEMSRFKAFVAPLGREIAELDAKGAPHSPYDAFKALEDHVPDLGVAIDCEDAGGARTEAMRVAALAVRVLFAIPDDE